MNAIEEYFASLPEERKTVFQNLWNVIGTNLPPGFQETVGYGMPGWVVPHSTYPAGYHCDPKLPLPFLNIASQKNFITVYHMGLYADPVLLEWFTSEWPTHTKQKLDMGKSCIRIKKMDDVPFELFAELARKMSPEDWIALYERNLKKK